MFCLNPACGAPENPDTNKFCQGCGKPFDHNQTELFRQRYQVIAVLGQGAFGRTYKVKDANFNYKLRVLKKFIGQAQGTALEKSQQLFDREAEKLDELKHEQIPTVYDHFQEGNGLYLVQEFIEGTDLLQELFSLGNFSEAKIREILLSLLPVLGYIHKKNLLHRDIKPDNIMRSQGNGKLILIDFGGVKEISGTGGTIIYTPGYAANEQMRGDPKIPSDIYSLGATCVRLLTACLPADNGTQDELYNAAEDSWLWKEKLQQQGKSISKQLEVVLDKMLARQLSQRYPSADAVLQDLMGSGTVVKPLSQNQPPKFVQMGVGTGVGAIAVLAGIYVFQPNIDKGRLIQLVLLGGGVGLGVSRLMGKKSQVEPVAPPPPVVKTPPVKSNPVVPQVTYLPPRQQTPQVKPPLKTTSFKTVTVNRQGEIIKRTNHSAQYYREDLGKGVSLEMMGIPGGSFWMGTEDEEIERLVAKFGSDWFRREGPRHKVNIKPFYIGKYQVTQAQWREVAKLEKINLDLKPEPSRFKGENRPVEKVSWKEAVEFCERISKATGKKYKLPSEAQWEYACRAGTETAFHYGETLTSDLANYNAKNTFAEEAKGLYREETTEVGKFPPNAFGLYDVHGNVWEWCEDGWHKNYEGAPGDGRAWLSTNTVSKIVRGGSWVNLPRRCRSAFRYYNDADNFDDNVGFRVVCAPQDS